MQLQLYQQKGRNRGGGWRVVGGFMRAIKCSMQQASGRGRQTHVTLKEK